MDELKEEVKTDIKALQRGVADLRQAQALLSATQNVHSARLTALEARDSTPHVPLHPVRSPYGRLRVRVGALFENRFDPGTSSRLNSVLNDDSGSVLVPGSNCVPENEKKVVPRQLPRLCWGTVWLFTSLLVAFLRESKFSLFTPLCNFYFCAERARRRAADRHVCRWEPPRRSTAAPLGPVGPSESTLR